MNNGPTSPRPRSRAFSYRSDKSAGKEGNKLDLTESPKEKQRRDSIRTSKANPNAAITEAQPGTLNLLEQTTLTSLREVQHKDINGNPIADPDLSNPTRPRLERPLDTIRAFEKAIDNGYKRRSSYNSKPVEAYDQNNQHASRRSSYLGGYDSGPSPSGRHSQAGGGYYGNGGQSYSGQNGAPRMRYGGGRVASDGAMNYGGNGNGRPYPNQQHGYQQSQDTMNTSGSDGTGPWANSTDPSSENSSIDKALPGHPQHQQFQGPIHEEGGARGNQYGAPPVQPPAPRRPIALGNSGDAPLPPGKLPPQSRPEPEQKKGWLKRRFSKKG